MEVTLKQMLDAGVHFGHQTSRWNPKMKKYIFEKKGDTYIIDVTQTIDMVNEAHAKIKKIVANGGIVLFVGTKTQARNVISQNAEKVGMPYVNERWIGGLLTNYKTISSRLGRLAELEEIDYDNPQNTGHTKKELLLLRREKNKLELSLGGVRSMTRTPAVLWIVDTNKEKLAVDEAHKLGIPVAAILDTNCDPDMVDIPIAGNDDSTMSVELLTSIIADAVKEGQEVFQSHVRKSEEKDDKETLDSAAIEKGLKEAVKEN
ncbi:MAG: 30S ribosomal protein S2 [Bifidobacteriaceae bacterium]|jgi:small subunit ribosomal protein S2|nr:30S ribosomal protein S2 [Bifidobacteriaceae bacterium]